MASPMDPELMEALGKAWAKHHAKKATNAEESEEEMPTPKKTTSATPEDVNAATPKPKSTTAIEKPTPSSGTLTSATNEIVLTPPKDMQINPKRHPVKPPKKPLPKGVTWLKGASSNMHRLRVIEAAKVYDRVSNRMTEAEKKLFVDMTLWLGDMPASSEKHVANHHLTKLVKNGREAWVLVYGLLILYPIKFSTSKVATYFRDTHNWTADVYTTPPAVTEKWLSERKTPSKRKRPDEEESQSTPASDLDKEKAPSKQLRPDESVESPRPAPVFTLTTAELLRQRFERDREAGFSNSFQPPERRPPPDEDAGPSCATPASREPERAELTVAVPDKTEKTLEHLFSDSEVEEVRPPPAALNGPRLGPNGRLIRLGKRVDRLDEFRERTNDHLKRLDIASGRTAQANQDTMALVRDLIEKMEAMHERIEQLEMELEEGVSE